MSPTGLGYLINSPLRLKRSQKYKEVVHPDAIKADQKMRIGNGSFVDNCCVPHFMTKRRFSLGEELYGNRAEIIVLPFYYYFVFPLYYTEVSVP